MEQLPFWDFGRPLHGNGYHQQTMAGNMSDNMIINEIRTLAENLNVHDFEPLSGGIGLGEWKPVTLGQREPAIIGESLRLAPTSRRPLMPTRKKGPLPLRGLIWLTAHVIDIFVVAATLATGICIAIFIQHTSAGAPPHREDLLKLTHHIGYVKAVLVIYAVFALYWVLLRLLSGGTIGYLWRKKILRRRLDGKYPQLQQNK